MRLHARTHTHAHTHTHTLRTHTHTHTHYAHTHTHTHTHTPGKLTYIYLLLLPLAMYRTYPRSHYDDRRATSAKKGNKAHGVGHSSSSGMATSNSSTESLSSKNSIDLAMQKLASLNVSGGQYIHITSCVISVDVCNRDVMIHNLSTSIYCHLCITIQRYIIKRKFTDI